MKKLLAFFLLLADPGAASAQSRLDLQAVPVTDALLVELLNGGEMQELNKRLPGKRQKLALRLPAVGHTGTCVQGTEWVCSYRYVLAVSEYDEAPAQAAYDLGESGEIVPLRWLPSGDDERVVLEVEVRNYPGHAAKENPKLVLQRRKFTIDVSLQGPGGQGAYSAGGGFSVAIVPLK